MLTLGFIHIRFDVEALIQQLKAHIAADIAPDSLKGVETLMMRLHVRAVGAHGCALLVMLSVIAVIYEQATQQHIALVVVLRTPDLKNT